MSWQTCCSKLRDEEETKMLVNGWWCGPWFFHDNPSDQWTLKEGKWLYICKILSSTIIITSWFREEAQKIRNRPYKYLLQGMYLWEHPKKRMETLLRVSCEKKVQTILLTEFHDSSWASKGALWQHSQNQKKNICGLKCTKMCYNLWKLLKYTGNAL